MVSVCFLWSLCPVDSLPPHADASSIPSLDLSKATNLKGVAFRPRYLGVQWITAALHTAETKNLQRISLVLPLHAIPETDLQEWLALDCLLVQIWTTHLLRPKVTYESETWRDYQADDMATLLPESVGRGIVDLVEHSDFLEQVAW